VFGRLPPAFGRSGSTYHFLQKSRHRNRWTVRDSEQVQSGWDEA